MREIRALDGKRILVVEDEYFIADDLRRALARAGAEVAGPVSSVEAALALVGEGGFDAAILDINLGGEMSFPIADALERSGTPFLLATGYDEWVIPTRFGAVPRSPKPFSIPLVVQQLARLSAAEPAA